MDNSSISVTRCVDLDEFIDEIDADHHNNEDIKYLFFLGAGCSKSSGIPLASELALEWYNKLKLQKTKYEKFNNKHNLNDTDENNEENVKSLYFEVFETLFHDPIGKQKEIQRITSDKLPALGYYTLAQLMQISAFNTVITTNFDDLIQDALIYNGEKRARVITHEELSYFIERSETPLICKIHGDAHFKPYNSTNETIRLPEKLSNKLETLFDNVRLVFIGYGGNDKSILNFLNKCNNLSQVYWLNSSEPTKVELAMWWDSLQHRVFIKEFDFDLIMGKMRSKFDLAKPNFDDLTKKLQLSYDQSLAEETKELENKLEKNASDYFLLGNNLYYEKQYSKALEAYKKSIEMNPEKDNAYINMGIAYGKNGEYDKAIETFQKAIEINPEKDSVYFNLGNAYDKNGEYDKAIETFQKAIEVNPENDNAYINMGIAYGKDREYDKAVETFQKAIEVNPENDNAYFNMGIAYGKNREYDKAIETFQKAIEMNPEKDNTYFNMGNAYEDNGEYDKAIEAYKKAIEMNPEKDNAYFNMGISYDNNGEYDKAIEAYKKTIEMNPEKDSVYYNMGISYDNNGEYDKAIETFQKAIEINPENNNAYFNMGIAYDNNGKYDKAIEAYKKAIKINPKDENTYINLIESTLISGIDLSIKLENKYKKYFTNKSSMGTYEMLKTLENIVKNKEYDLDSWQEKYKDTNLGDYNFDGLDKWANNQFGNVKKELQRALKVFKKYWTE